MNRRAHILLAVSLLLGAGCSDDEAPEQRVRALIEQAEVAAERKQIRELRGYVSPHYTDAAGRDRRAIEAVLRLYLLRNESIHLLTRIESITVVPPNRADAVVYVAMAGRPIANAEELADFRGNLYRFELALLLEDDDWRVASAAWRAAELADFIYSN